MNSAPERQQNKSMARMEKLNVLSNTEGCNKKWLKCAKQVLQWNSLNPHVFAAAIRELLQKGRNKKTNIFLTGSSNCGKLFYCNHLNLFLSASLVLHWGNMPGLARTKLK